MEVIHDTSPLQPGVAFLRFSDVFRGYRKATPDCSGLNLQIFGNFQHLLNDASHVCNFSKKETPAQVFFCDFCNIFKNTIF